MASDIIPVVSSSDSEQPEAPTEQASLQIRRSPLNIAMSTQGSATNTLVLGVIGPGVTIAAGHFGGLPAWAIVLICALQILCAVAIRHRSP